MLLSNPPVALAVRKKLMKPAPAIATRATSGLAGSAATIACASSRGLHFAAFASRMATFVAKSRCFRKHPRRKIPQGSQHELFKLRLQGDAIPGMEGGEVYLNPPPHRTGHP